MLPVTSALPPLIAQSHDELHRPDQKLERLSLNPDMPMLTPVEVEYAPAAPATWHHSQRRREATRDNTRERAAPYRLPSWLQRTTGKRLGRFYALVRSQRPLRCPQARACCAQLQQRGHTFGNVSRGAGQQAAGAVLESLRGARVEQVAVAELCGGMQRDCKAVVHHNLVYGKVMPGQQS